MVINIKSLPGSTLSVRGTSREAGLRRWKKTEAKGVGKGGRKTVDGDRKRWGS